MSWRIVFLKISWPEGMAQGLEQDFFWERVVLQIFAIVMIRPEIW